MHTLTSLATLAAIILVLLTYGLDIYFSLRDQLDRGTAPDETTL